MENNLESILQRQIEQLRLKERDGNRFMFIGFGVMLAFLIYDLFMALETNTPFFLTYALSVIPQYGILVLAELFGYYLISFIGLIIGIIGFIKRDRARNKRISLTRELNNIKNS